MDFDLLIQRKRERFEQLEREIADPSLFENRNRAGEIMREHANVKALLAKWNELSSARMQLADNRELANSTAWPDWTSNSRTEPSIGLTTSWRTPRTSM